MLLTIVLFVIAVVLVVLFGGREPLQKLATIGGLAYCLWFLVQLARWILGLSGGGPS